MKLEVIETKDRYVKLKIVGEDYTLGNIVQKALLNDKRIIGAGFYIPHPLKNEMIFEIFFDEKVPKEVWKDIIIEDIKKIRSMILSVKDHVLKALDKEGVL